MFRTTLLTAAAAAAAAVLAAPAAIAQAAPAQTAPAQTVPAQTPAASQTPQFKLKRLTSDLGLAYQPAISSDSKLVAYASDRAGEGLRERGRQVQQSRFGGGVGDAREKGRATNDANGHSPKANSLSQRSQVRSAEALGLRLRMAAC